MDTDDEPDAIVNRGPKSPEDAIAATSPGPPPVEVSPPATQSIDVADKAGRTTSGSRRCGSMIANLR